MKKDRVANPVIGRLPRYYRCVEELYLVGCVRVSSATLSQRLGFTASQIRQDFSNFGEFGQQGYGYNVQFLYDEIGKILGQTHMNHVILVGVGNLGQAIANYVRFEKLSFKMIGLFDIDPSKKGKEVSGIKIQMVDELEDFIKTHQVDIAALTIPKESAEPIARKLTELGVKALWNFAHVDLDVPEGVIVENVHLSDSLMTLSYNITKMK